MVEQPEEAQKIADRFVQDKALEYVTKIQAPGITSENLKNQ
ncbi:MAG: hypothetical protein QM752_02165 [Gammaproteobacteria bacterium]